MNNTPLISLIIPCYNAEFSLEKCLKSVIEQDYPTLEIIIIDDGSTDNSSKIYEEFQRKYQRIKIIKQENAGVANARNKGIKIANGEYLCFVDSDDWVEKNYCSELYRLLISESADISIIEASYENLDGEIIFQKPTSSEKVFDGNRALVLLLEDKVLQSHPWGKLYKVSFLKNINFPENLKCFEDYSTLFKVFDKAIKVVKSNEKLYHYIQHDDSLSHNLSPETAYHFFLAIMETFKFCEKTKLFQNNGKIAKNMVKKLLMVLKRIIRNTTPNQMQNEKEKIRQSFKPFLKFSVNQIGIEYYFYLRLYYYYPKIYTNLISK